MVRRTVIALFFAILWGATAFASETWLVTAYCPDKTCCGSKACGLTASGKMAKPGMVACNWLPFGTRVQIQGLGIFTVEDRGAKSLFGSKTNHIKHVDVFFKKHSDAKKFGKKYLVLDILK